eukprot:11509821-Karenia_brevis.AAC.1
MAKDYGDEKKVIIHTDSSSCKGTATRLGLGKIRHLDTALLRLQHHIRRGKLWLRKVLETENVADIGTKDVDRNK